MQVKFGAFFSRGPEADTTLAVKNYNEIQKRVADKLRDNSGLAIEHLAGLAQATGVNVNYFA